jgi:hypothetical protein
VNATLARACVRTGWTARLTTHGIRKSVGTIMARQNQRYALKQLGIKKKVFDQNYNQPTGEDRLERRDLEPIVGPDPGPTRSSARPTWTCKLSTSAAPSLRTSLNAPKRMRHVPAPRAPETFDHRAIARRYCISRRVVS